ncbi:MAG TPA: hypothetical protein VEZ17_10000 [Chitinophagaceae bacterium]|nr:hypothetical protein [Chitinophagaceae bacterium]
MAITKDLSLLPALFLLLQHMHVNLIQSGHLGDHVAVKRLYLSKMGYGLLQVDPVNHVDIRVIMLPDTLELYDLPMFLQ